LLTCKAFLQELNDYLDEKVDKELKAHLEEHVNQCPNCWVICDTTKKTIKVFKGMEEKVIPQNVHDRLMVALEKRMQSRKAITS